MENKLGMGVSYFRENGQKTDKLLFEPQTESVDIWYKCINQFLGITDNLNNTRHGHNTIRWGLLTVTNINLYSNSYTLHLISFPR